MRVLVAGGTGVVGRRLIPRLVAAGHDVWGTSRSIRGTACVESLGARGIRMDALDAASVRAAVALAAPEALMIQLTALRERDFSGTSRLRSNATPLLVDAVRAVGARRVVSQSIAWAYEPGDKPADETVPLDSDPGRAGMVKAVRDLEAASALLDQHVILRYGILYGPGTWYSPGDWIAQQLRAGELPADDGLTSFCHVEDAARAAAAALDWPSGVVNVVDDEPATGKQWLPLLASALGEPAPAVRDGGQGWQRGASNRKARDELGWAPTYHSWRRGFADTAGEPACTPSPAPR